jgi:hypothetical protein
LNIGQFYKSQSALPSGTLLLCTNPPADGKHLTGTRRGIELLIRQKMQKTPLHCCFEKRPTSAQGSSAFLLTRFKIFLPRYVSAYSCHPQGVVSA